MTTGKGVPITVRLQPNDLELLDVWIAANHPTMGRPAALRQMLRAMAIRMR